jgi:hypothetical protein
VPYASEGEGLHLPPVPEALNRCVLRKQVPWGVAIIDRALEITDNAVGCQQEGLSLERCTGVISGVGAVGTAEVLCFSKT